MLNQNTSPPLTQTGDACRSAAGEGVDNQVSRRDDLYQPSHHVGWFAGHVELVGLTDGQVPLFEGCRRLVSLCPAIIPAVVKQWHITCATAAGREACPCCVEFQIDAEMVWARRWRKGARVRGRKSRSLSVRAWTLERLQANGPIGNRNRGGAGRGKMVRSFPLARQKMYAAFLRCRVKRGADAVFCRDSSAWTATVETEITLPSLSGRDTVGALPDRSASP